MSVHRPEHCYRSAGYEMTGPAERLGLSPAGTPPVEVWTGTFTRDDLNRPEAGPSRMQIFWTWCVAGRWQAADNPRLAFARAGALYKMYVIRNVTGSAGPADDPAVNLLGQLLPILTRTLTPS
jgi:hypothetical protein